MVNRNELNWEGPNVHCRLSKVLFSFYIAKRDGSEVPVRCSSDAKAFIVGKSPNLGYVDFIKREKLLNPKKEYLQADGSLHLQCHMIFEVSGIAFYKEAAEKLAQLRLSAEECSDFIIANASGKEHKVIYIMCTHTKQYPSMVEAVASGRNLPT